MDTRLVRLESDRVKIIKRISDLAFLNEELDKNQVKLADAQRTINVTQGVLDRLNTLPIYNQGPIDFTKNQQAQARIRETQAREAIAYIQTRLSER